MIGDEIPAGTGTFHWTFRSGPISTGGFCPSATPDPPGPRNCGQASGLSPQCPMAVNTPIAAHAVMTVMFVFTNSLLAVLVLPAHATRSFYKNGDWLRVFG